MVNLVSLWLTYPQIAELFGLIVMISPDTWWISQPWASRPCWRQPANDGDFSNQKMAMDIIKHGFGQRGDGNEI